MGRPRYERKCPRSHDKLPKAHFYGKSNLLSVEDELNMQRQQGLYLVETFILGLWVLLFDGFHESVSLPPRAQLKLDMVRRL